MSVRIGAGRRLQAAGAGSLHTLLLGPDHRPQDELQGMEHSPRGAWIVYPVPLAALSNHINVPLKAKKPDAALGCIYSIEDKPACFAVYPTF